MNLVIFSLLFCQDSACFDFRFWSGQEEELYR